MRVLVADTLPDACLEAIQRLGCELTSAPKLTAGDLEQRLEGVDVLVVRSTEVSAAAIQSSDTLSLIIRAGAGTNNIDKQAASARGVFVANCPGTNSIAVAELTMALICALERRIVENVVDLREGVWNKAEYSRSDGLYGKTLGIVGVGQIGCEVIERAKPFGLRLLACSRSLTPQRAKSLGVEHVASLAELAPQCDILSLHLPATPETQGVVSRAVLESMKPGAALINTARAEVIDEQALVELVRDGRLRVGVDVLADEPEGKQGEYLGELGRLPGVYATHHIGASTEQAQQAVAAEVVRLIEKYMTAGQVDNWVNRMLKTPARWQLVVRHYDKPGVLAAVLTLLKEDNVNAEEIENVIFAGAEAACCTIQLDTRPSDDTLRQIDALEGQVIHCSLISVD